MARSRRFEDDDEDDFPARRSRRDEPPASGGNTAVKIIGIIGGVLVVLFLVCGGLVYYVFYSTKKAVNEVGQDVAKRVDKMAEEARAREKELENSDKSVSHRAAEAFVQELKGRRTDAAYDLTTAAYQKRVTREEFATLLEQYKDQVGTGVPFTKDFGAPDMGTSYSYKKTLHNLKGGGFLEMLVTMVKVGTAWKVDQFTIEPKR